MKIIGIDLAGMPKNASGICTLVVNDKDEKSVTTKILHENSEIIEYLTEIKPDIIAVDAPLTFTGENRHCDEELRKYGALPVTLRGMEMLSMRGTELAGDIKKLNMNFIEIFSTATAKILGFYDKDLMKKQKNLVNFGVLGDTEKRILKKDEIDAIFAAITGYLYLEGLTEDVGDEKGRVVIPKV